MVKQPKEQVKDVLDVSQKKVVVAESSPFVVQTENEYEVPTDDEEEMFEVANRRS